MAIARANGKLKGKQPKLSAHQRVHVLKPVQAGDHTIAGVGERVGVLIPRLLQEAFCAERPGLAVSRASSTASSLAERSSRRPSRVAARVELDPCRPEFTSSGHPKQSRAGERSAVASSWSVARGSNDLPPARVEEVNELLGAHGEAQRRDLKRGMRGHVPT
jgi:hypothetical protein